MQASILTAILITEYLIIQTLSVPIVILRSIPMSFQLALTSHKTFLSFPSWLVRSSDSDKLLADNTGQINKHEVNLLDYWM